VDEDYFSRLAMTHMRSRVQKYGSRPRNRMSFRSHLQEKDAYIAPGRSEAVARTGPFRGSY